MIVRAMCLQRLIHYHTTNEPVKSGPSEDLLIHLAHFWAGGWTVL